MIQTLQVERAAVISVDKGALRQVAGHGIDEAVGDSGQVSQEILKQTLARSKPLLIASASQSEDFADSTSLLLTGTQSAVCVPVKDRSGKVFALLYADQVTSGKSLTYLEMSQLVLEADKMAGLKRSEPVSKATSTTSKKASKAAPQKPRPLKGAGPPLPAPSAQGLTFFFRALSVMVGSGVPLIGALDLLANQSADPVISQVSGRLLKGLESGYRPSAIMQHETQVFSGFQTQMMAIAETSGSLHLCLGKLADYEDKRQSMLRKLKSAITYPTFLFLCCTAMLILAPPYLLAGHLEFLQKSGAELPLITRLLVGVSDLIRSPYGLLLLSLMVIGVVLGTRYWMRDESRVATLLEAARAIPPLHRLLTNMALSRFSRALSLLLERGVYPLQALPLAAAATSNPLFKEAAVGVAQDLEGGSSLSDALKEEPIFPTKFIELVRSGEETAHLPKMLEYCADMNEVELEHSYEVLSSLLEPLIMTVMGVAIGTMLLATMLPMMQLLEKI
jgi:type II secretory pathway component PulF